MSDVPERIALRWVTGAAVLSGPLMTHPEYTQFVRADLAQAPAPVRGELAAVLSDLAADQTPMDLGITEAEWEGLYESEPAALDAPDAGVVAELVEALRWYGEQSRLARLIHSEGDAGRHAIAADGGNRAAAALAKWAAK
jgi:hypothetical protein